AITFMEQMDEDSIEKQKFRERLHELIYKNTPVLGITGTGGAGKSSLTDELIRRFLNETKDKKVAILSVDPTKRKTGGALLGDRIRMNAIFSNRVYMRSLATRSSRTELSTATQDVIDIFRATNYDLIIVETSGIGQGDAEITEITDLSMYVMTAEFGAPTQLEKIDMIDYADFIAINKFEQGGSVDAFNQVRKQYERSRMLFHQDHDTFPIYGTIASQFNDPGTNALFTAIVEKLRTDYLWEISTTLEGELTSEERKTIIPNDRIHYLREISSTVRSYHEKTRKQSNISRNLYQLQGVKEMMEDESIVQALENKISDLEQVLDKDVYKELQSWEDTKKTYDSDTFTFKVRDKDITLDIKTTSLSGLKIPKVKFPSFEDWGDRITWLRKENVPGAFPFTVGVFPFKRQGEDPTRQFAGEGTPDKTNRRFHYLSEGEAAKRLSTAFDSVTLYGEDPAYEPDVYGKVGESGVSVCTLNDMKKLYDGFDLI